jgi:uncharacterized protein (DUF1330 family)
MAKAYWLSIYRSIHDPEKLAAYAKLAGPAIIAGGGRTLARGVAALVHEAGLKERSDHRVRQRGSGSSGVRESGL